MRLVLTLFLAAGAALAADLTGIWVGQQPGRNGQTDDVAFRFRQSGQALTGKLFGEEFDLPIEEAAVSGDEIRFTVVTTNYYSGTKARFVYTGAVKNGELELVRERIQTPEEKAANRPVQKQTIRLKRL